jgi:WD40-like Beta Propeller Repeat
MPPLLWPIPVARPIVGMKGQRTGGLMANLLDRLTQAPTDRYPADREIGRAGIAQVFFVHPLLAALLLTALACSGNPVGPTIRVIDRDRHAQFTADGQTIVYYADDEIPGGAVGIYRVDLASGDVHQLIGAILAGMALDPHTDSVVFSSRASGEVEPALFIMGLDGGGVRRLGGAGGGPGFRWPSFSVDGTHIAWEARYQDATGLDTVSTIWIGDWQNGAIVNPRAVGPGRRTAWRPDGAALAVERRRPGDAEPLVMAVMDTTGQLLNTLGYGYEPAWRPDGGMVAYLAETVPDRGCQGVCFVPAGGGTPVSLSTDFMSFPGGWSRDGTQFVYARLMRTYEIAGDPPVDVEESRLWVRTLATGADRQVTF